MAQWLFWKCRDKHVLSLYVRGTKLKQLKQSEKREWASSSSKGLDCGSPLSPHQGHHSTSCSCSLSASPLLTFYSSVPISIQNTVILKLTFSESRILPPVISHFPDGKLHPLRLHPLPPPLFFLLPTLSDLCCHFLTRSFLSSSPMASVSPNPMAVSQFPCYSLLPQCDLVFLLKTLNH